MEFQDIVYEKDQGIAVIKLARPHVLNALRDRTWQEIDQVITDLRGDKDIRVLVFTGEGRAFSVGADIKEMGEDFQGKVNFFEVRKSVLRMQRITQEIINLQQPTIAAVNGYALGAGAELAILCDLRVASEKAEFGFPEVKVGLFETNGVTHILPGLVGLGRAKELMLTGNTVDAGEALRIGLVEKVVPHERLMEEAKKLARRIAANAPVSTSLVKRCLNTGAAATLETALTYETEAVMACLLTEDVREGMLAFLEGREPSFKGR
ncbi:MAG: enoyl-CoA hydratase/isomerase family protein [Clostridia bacterium]|nr:enoyl-CoA hydratase/isomerase family protein [Clostridia bacterium]